MSKLPWLFGGGAFAAADLLKQMVGRALRGPLAGGTETAHLVSFADHWEEFADWLDPRSLFPATEITETELTPPGRTVSMEVPSTSVWQASRRRP